MDLVEKANKGVEQMLDKEMEDSNDSPMERVIDDRVKSGITEGLKPM